MMIRGAINRIFAVAAEEKPTIDAREPPNHLQLPTVDERVNLYLQAVHGNRDFTNKEYSDARSLILDAMAADIAANSQVNLQRRPWVPPKPAEGPHPDAMLSAVAAALALPVDYQRNVHYQTSKVARSAMLSHCEDWSVARSEPVLSRAFIPPRSDAVGPPSPARIRKIAKRSIQICAVAAATGIAALLLITILPTTTFQRVETAASPSATPTETTTVAQQLGPAEVEVAPHPYLGPEWLNLPPPQLGPGYLTLGKQGGPWSTYLNLGNIASARMSLKQAAEGGSAAAALELGATYDPFVLDELSGRGVALSAPSVWPTTSATPPASAWPEVGVKPPVDVTIASDVAMARAWYEKARDLGSTEAAGRLERLAGRDLEGARRDSTAVPDSRSGPVPRPVPSR